MGKRKLTSLQPVNVLGVEPQKEPFVMQEPQEIVGIVGSVISRVQLLGQSEKGLGVDKEIGQFEDGFWIRDVILLKVTVEAAPWGPAKRGKQDWWSDCRKRTRSRHNRAHKQVLAVSCCFASSIQSRAASGEHLKPPLHRTTCHPTFWLQRCADSQSWKGQGGAINAATDPSSKHDYHPEDLGQNMTQSGASLPLADRE